MGTTLKHRAKLKTRSKQLKIAIDAVYDTVDILALVASKRSVWLSAFSIGVKLYGALSKHAEDAGIMANDDDVFQKEGWSVSKFESWDNFIYQVADEMIAEDKKYSFPSKNENLVYKIFEYEGIEFGFYFSKEDNICISGPWWPPEACEEDHFTNLLSDLIWSKFPNGFCEVSKMKMPSSYVSNLMATEVPTKDANGSLYSETADKILKSVVKYKEAGFSRSIMLNGEPGSGKTSAMNYVAANFGGKVIRFSLNQIKSGVDTTSGIELLQPSTVLIDDFDRLTSGHDSMLESIEKLSARVKLIMVSTNSLKEMPKAIMRPGRFDEILQIDGLDEGLTRSIIGDVPECIINRLLKLPIAYIKEFKKREQVLGIDEAVKTLVNLELRFQNANNYADSMREMQESDEDYDCEEEEEGEQLLLD